VTNPFSPFFFAFVSKMSKLQPHQEHPGEVLCYRFAEWVSPFFKKLGFTPNGITTLSNVGAAAALYGAYTKQPMIFVVGYAAKYLFDCTDGFYARKYGMTSKFGDLYDHLSDLTFMLSLLGVLWTQFGFTSAAYPYRGYILAMYGLMVFASWIHMGCQEVIYSRTSGKPSTPTLSWYQSACPEPDRYIQWTRWVGSSFAVVLMGIVLILTALDWKKR
jgi:phosphatidylglycerophosphate synthase